MENTETGGATESPNTSPIVESQTKAASGLAVAALVTGIVGFLFGLLAFVGLLIGVVAVVLGILALKKKQPKGLAVTGLALGAVGAITGLIATIFFLTALSSVGAGFQAATEATNSSTESDSSEPSATPEAPGVGTPVVDGAFTFTVTGVECGIPSVGSEYFNETAQGQYCRVGLTVLNSGTKPEYMFADNQLAFDAAGREFSYDSGATLYDGDNSDIWMTEVNPGNTLTGSLIFDIPTDATLTSMELHENAFSKGVKVTLQ